jgi:ABC-type lipoprotein release transport system permease subunit
MWALGFLRRRRGRVLLTVLGVALAVGLTTTMVSISAGLDITSRRVIADTGLELLVLDKGSAVFGSGNHLAFENGTRLADEFQAMTMGSGHPVATAFPIFEKTVTVFPQNFSACSPSCRAVNPLADGENPGLRGALGGLDIESGSYFVANRSDPFASDPAYLNRSLPGGFSSANFTHEIVLNRAVARELNAKVGDTVLVSATREFNASQPFRVVGVYEASFETDQSREVRVHRSELLYLAGKVHDEATLIAVDLVDPTQAPQVAALIESAHPELQAAEASEILGELDRTTGVFKLFAGLVAAVSIGVAVLFAATVYMISARERVGEIAALRAIGISRRTILSGMLVESGVLGAVGLAAGLAFGTLSAWAIDFVLKATTTRVPHGMDVTAVTPEVVLLVGIMSVIIGIAAGMVPAVWATRLNIASAIRNL